VGLLLVPLVGDLPARQSGVPIGSLLIFAVSYVCIRWIAATTKLQLLGVGLRWVVLTVLFEIVLGRLALGLPWDRITEDYDPARGGRRAITPMRYGDARREGDGFRDGAGQDVVPTSLDRRA
jgi:hypothetical protein